MIALASDHGGFDLKEAIKAQLEKDGLEYKDFGTYSKERCDTIDFAAPAAKAVAVGECDRGIFCCTTGIGVSMIANKVRGIRCALVGDLMTARLTRQHNNSNVLAIGAGVVAQKMALEIVETWLNTEFLGGVYAERVEKLMRLDAER